MSTLAVRTWRLVLLLGAAVVAMGCGRREHTVADAFRWSEPLPEGATIHLRNTNGTIRVRPTSESAPKVVGAKRWRFGRERDIQFVANRIGNDVYVCAVWRSSGRCDEEGYRFSSRRMFRFFGIRWGTDARATLTVDLPAGVKVDARTTSGSLDIQGARAGGNASTVNGSIVLKEAAGSFALSSVNGGITAAIDSLADHDTLSFETVNGSVRANLPRDYDGAVSLSTVNGGVRTDFPITTTGSFSRRKLVGKVGESSQLLRVQTVNGGITLSKL
jgi:hypothetical protein